MSVHSNSLHLTQVIETMPTNTVANGKNGNNMIGIANELNSIYIT
jgi:hypothetical protein